MNYLTGVGFHQVPDYASLNEPDDFAIWTSPPAMFPNCNIWGSHPDAANHQTGERRILGLRRAEPRAELRDLVRLSVARVVVGQLRAVVARVVLLTARMSDVAMRGSRSRFALRAVALYLFVGVVWQILVEVVRTVSGRAGDIAAFAPNGSLDQSVIAFVLWFLLPALTWPMGVATWISTAIRGI